ncbi:MAG TPA: molybdopterin-synthase adenylyltransferase MoeB [Candidatus Limnocylindria bacterium]|nr:molybdopterin-synthase adenylyltransferase MoeB [Candidatus Limnocylindria bacterium]
MSVSTRIHIPTPLRPYADQQAVVEVPGATIGEALAALVGRHAELKRHLYDEQGQLRRFVNVYRNDEDIRHLQREATPLRDQDTVSIVPSIAGGADERSQDSSAQATAGVIPRPQRPAPPAWSTGADGLPPLSQAELMRYSRHLILPEVGLQGQRKLKAASVLIVGAGGLGSPLALYLAAAGVGRLGIVDFDRVDESNLQRQILHGTSSVGTPKLESARARLHDMNPGVVVDGYETRISSENALELMKPYDVVVDGTDNFPTRYLVNDACALLGKPNVYGSIFRFEGQASVFDARTGPCYRCLYPDPPPPGLVPSCAEGGVLGVLPGVIGVIQGIETLKIILGIGESLIGRLLLFDALAMSFRELKLRKDPDCPLCGTHPTIRELIDYEQFCGLSSTEQAAADAEAWEIGARDLASRRQGTDAPMLIDVREPHEYEIARIPGAVLMPLNTLPARLSELDSSREIVLHCHHGQRSMRALELLHRSGFRKLKNLRGGIDAWSKEVDPEVPRY